jgi:hypothetical protein
MKGGIGRACFLISASRRVSRRRRSLLRSMGLSIHLRRMGADRCRLGLRAGSGRLRVSLLPILFFPTRIGMIKTADLFWNRTRSTSLDQRSKHHLRYRRSRRQQHRPHLGRAIRQRLYRRTLHCRDSLLSTSQQPHQFAPARQALRQQDRLRGQWHFGSWCTAGQSRLGQRYQAHCVVECDRCFWCDQYSALTAAQWDWS